ncbi:MAG: chaperone modulator CbpM [Betaproteobacteria bacterium]
MDPRNPRPSGEFVVEVDYSLTLVELCRASDASESDVRAWIEEGALAPKGRRPDEWRFAASSLARARTAARLARDFEIDARAIALVLDLMEEISRLRAGLR